MGDLKLPVDKGVPEGPGIRVLVQALNSPSTRPAGRRGRPRRRVCQIRSDTPQEGHLAHPAQSRARITLKPSRWQERATEAASDVDCGLMLTTVPVCCQTRQAMSPAAPPSLRLGLTRQGLGHLRCARDARNPVGGRQHRSRLRGGRRPARNHAWPADARPITAAGLRSGRDPDLGADAGNGVQRRAAGG